MIYEQHEGELKYGMSVRHIVDNMKDIGPLWGIPGLVFKGYNQGIKAVSYQSTENLCRP